MLHRLVSTIAVAGGLALAAQAQAAPLPSYNIVVGSGGPSTAYYVGHSADDTDTVSVVAGLADFFINQTTAIGTSAALGTFGDGAEIEFSLDDLTVPATWYTGPGSRNSDGNVHADVTSDITDITGLSAASYAFADTLPTGTTFVGFEDRTGNQSDYDYNDLVFAVVNSAPANVPEPTSLALLGAGVIGLGLTMRRRATLSA